MGEVCDCCDMNPCKHARVHKESGSAKALVPKEKYDQAMKDWSVDAIKKTERIVELEKQRDEAVAHLTSALLRIDTASLMLRGEFPAEASSLDSFVTHKNAFLAKVKGGSGE